MKNKLQAYNLPKYYKLSKLTENKISKGLKLNSNAERLFELNNIPDIKRLFLSNKISFETVLKFRSKPTANKFRKWMRENIDYQNQEALSREYVRAITQNDNFFQTTKGRLVKTISFFTIGSALGSAIGGIEGAAAGSLIGTVLEKTVDLSLNMWEEFFLDGILTGWTPKAFFDDLTSLHK